MWQDVFDDDDDDGDDMTIRVITMEVDAAIRPPTRFSFTRKENVKQRMAGKAVNS